MIMLASISFRARPRRFIDSIVDNDAEEHCPKYNYVYVHKSAPSTNGESEEVRTT